ncbi:polysaccharide pyruvyl transferase family protein [Rhizobium sp. CSW-27]|uniref:polysaccharide pyruvyl transferase family protein n=1 Tax=Rhizobium sp. CSW-27 TaxID=2839985 RepID=UPI001C0336B0|nr:polysaccharide pyruvyl transferase family protein [Rhizobium sp. CSW-27]MBT9369024.1 polysaccharide pyruvyl transferase family protein [Rhizobium sp. CSW-27]
MKPYYWESHHGNFGDDLNLWLWDYLLPGLREVHPQTLLVGVGTVLNPVLLPKGTPKLVIGSGYGYGTPPDISDRSEWDVRAVRGPLTADKLGLPADMGIIDPAVMVTDMPEFQNQPKRFKRTFVPHWESAEFGIWEAVCEPAGLTYLDPRGEAREVIARIAQSELIVAESMHAAILADAFRVPWIAVSTSRAINSFKWSDWAATVGVTYRPRYVPVSTRAEAIHKQSRFWGLKFEGNSIAQASPAPVADGDVGTLPPRTSTQAPWRKAAKQVLAAPSALALWQASRTEPQLSAGDRLEERKERLRTVLEGVRRDYF